MKVGVVTYSSTIDNYGQVLQYLATQEFLKDFDFDVFLLREKVNNPLWKRLLRPLYYFIKNIILRKRLDSEFKQKRMKFKKWHSISDKMEKKHPRHFEEFRKKKILRLLKTMDRIFIMLNLMLFVREVIRFGLSLRFIIF